MPLNHDDHNQLLTVWRQASVDLPMPGSERSALMNVVHAVEAELADQEIPYYEEQVSKRATDLSNPSSVYLQLTTDALDLIQRYLSSVVSSILVHDW